MGDNIELNAEKIKLCKEIGCFSSDLKDAAKIKERGTDQLNNNELNKDLMNYGRVRSLTGKFDIKTISKKLKKDGFLTKSNEIAAMLFYFDVVKENIKNDASIFMETLSEGTRIKKAIVEYAKNKN